MARIGETGGGETMDEAGARILRFTDYLRRAFENMGSLGDCRTMDGTDEEKSAAAQWLASVEFEPIEF